ncbi:MAG: peptidase U32 family protein [Rikenellaceae bacterium]
MITNRNEVEIMAPVGSYESLAAAIQAGANSVYFGVEQLNMRSRSAANFTLVDLAKIVAKAREHNVKTYLTVNTVLYDQDIETMHAIMDCAKKEGITAIIASDQAAILYASSIGLEVHISTQLNVSNFETLKFYAQYADVIVLARELTIDKIKAISEKIKETNLRGPSGELVQIEMFAHGALCMAISGKCYLSLHDNDCSANRGACRQICRRSYNVTDSETGEELKIENHYIMSPKDLCTIDFLDKFIDAGVRVLKIEGRARSAEYVKRVCECYNTALEAMAQGTYTQELKYELVEKLKTVFNRGFWGGYYMGERAGEWCGNYGSTATQRKVYVGKVTNFFGNASVAEVQIEASPLELGEQILFMGETTGVLEMDVEEIRVALKPVERTVQGELCSIKTPSKVRRGDKLYKMVSTTEE